MTERLKLEKDVIAQYMKNPNSYKFGGLDSDTPYLRIVAQTNSKTPYVLRIEFPGHPNEKPNAYVECMLRDYNNNPMDHASSTNHTLSPHANGWTQICHYHPSAWQPNMSLWMVYLRCVMWLNIYEQTIRDHHSMDYYLSHMSEGYCREEYLNL